MMMGGVTIFAFWYGYASMGYSPFDPSAPESVVTAARTLAFITLVLTQMFFALSLQYEHYGIFSKKSWENRFLVASVVVAILLQIILISWEPMSEIFHLSQINMQDWDVVIFLALLPLVANEIRKAIRNHGFSYKKSAPISSGL